MPSTQERLRDAATNQRTVRYLPELFEITSRLYDAVRCETPDFSCGELESFGLCPACYAQHKMDKLMEQIYDN